MLDMNKQQINMLLVFRAVKSIHIHYLSKSINTRV